MAKQSIYVVSREAIVEARSFLELDKEAAVLLVGRGLLLPANLFAKRSVFAIAEEVTELGLEGKLSKGIEVKPAADIVDLLVDRQVLNFS